MKKGYITTGRLGSGYAALQLFWDPEHGGFWDVWQTGYGRYATKAEAEAEARSWAKSEKLEYKEDGTP